jgi:hypothetical protein
MSSVLSIGRVTLRSWPPLRSYGFGGELRAAFAGESGTWGGILMRRAADSDVGPDDTAWLASRSGRLAEGLRRAVLLTARAG